MCGSVEQDARWMRRGKQKPQKGDKPKNRSKARKYVSVKRRSRQRRCELRALVSKMQRCAQERKVVGEL